MIEFELQGLNSKQRLLADLLWSCEEWDEVEALMKALPKRERIECEGIIEMMKMAVVEQCYDGIQPLDEANKLINRVKGQ